MKFIYSDASDYTNRSFHITNSEGDPLCHNGAAIDPKNLKTASKLPTGASICRLCLKRGEIKLLIPSRRSLRTDGQVLSNRAVASNQVNVDNMVLGSTQLSPKGKKLLMLQLNSQVTWYFPTVVERNKNLQQITNKINLP